MYVWQLHDYIGLAIAILFLGGLIAISIWASWKDEQPCKVCGRPMNADGAFTHWCNGG